MFKIRSWRRSGTLSLFLSRKSRLSENCLFIAVFRFLRTQSFKRLPPFDVLVPVNQSYEHDRTAFETFLNPPTYTDVFTSLSWLVSFHSGDYRSFDWREQKTSNCVSVLCLWVRRKRKIAVSLRAGWRWGRGLQIEGRCSRRTVCYACHSPHLWILCKTSLMY